LAIPSTSWASCSSTRYTQQNRQDIGTINETLDLGNMDTAAGIPYTYLIYTRDLVQRPIRLYTA